jgi:hypothetical protein
MLKVRNRRRRPRRHWNKPNKNLNQLNRSSTPRFRSKIMPRYKQKTKYKRSQLKMKLCRHRYLKVKPKKWRASSNKVKFTSNSYRKSKRKRKNKNSVTLMKMNWLKWKVNTTISKRNTETSNKKLSIKMRTLLRWEKNILKYKCRNKTKPIFRLEIRMPINHNKWL